MKQNKKTKTCRRCNGTGMYASNLVCFSCGGSGSTLTKYGMTQRLWNERIEMYQSGEYDRTIKILNDEVVNKEAEMNKTNHEGLKNHYRNQIDEVKKTIANKIAAKAEFDEDFTKYGNGDFPTELLNIKFNTAIL